MIAIALAGCASDRKFSQSDFDKISDKCGLPRSTLNLRGKDELQLQPPLDAKYEAVDCILKELKKANYPLKMGFVGNELYKEEASNAQAH
ncbi:MAG: hypothetical protein EPO45_05720 [Sphingobium sp.]|uniref:hypothetical protein n=1 Tax=Sphingobium TaxID=165695 RepID=UPI0003785E97|nr:MULTISPECIES: hypothetical protein [Sphingobium]MBU0658135.1 hypothetical protein [Alphaproteobacteria bacterium]MBA4755615.1 hypothetical protein [Sphingobium sp.]MBG6117100.1 hypothetical protein [Sphingobium sp. JAI105]MBU1794572.1 hypothetical protein [Alphaproteobacteria bacterium]PSO11342.1 hypothetical protein C7E20_11695 [Sphingobium sp. AEW4]